MMRLAFQVAYCLLIVGGVLYAGLMNFFSPQAVLEQYYVLDVTVLDVPVQAAVVTQVRLLSGMWVATGFVLLFCVRRFERHGLVLQLGLLGLSLGAAGEFVSMLPHSGLQPALLKAGTSISICVVMEIWRHLITSRAKS